MSFGHSSVTVRSATEADLNDVADLVQGFAMGHPVRPEARGLGICAAIIAQYHAIHSLGALAKESSPAAYVGSPIPSECPY